MIEQLIDTLSKDYPDLKKTLTGFSYQGNEYCTDGYNLLAQCEILVKALTDELK